ncbi:hypothetical protein CRU98_05705 [Arcobacter sp. CECT 8986]|uniref:hypothetical protein n=1 Tax=Arcobacter sp. CECT 8986 TaxID=2044507 RepID=UPI001009A0C5|nr:hypothetical protein [Arcobacter sp. CECT 8986]RXJ99522.1 hypothetical protein CRU98_05705 [Arcobacter sp. CECT 8986]
MVMSINNSKLVKQAINEELETLNSNIKKVANILANKNTPYAVGVNAEKLLTLFTQIKDTFEKEEELEKINALIEKLPLLYLQIRKLKLGVRNENKNN